MSSSSVIEYLKVLTIKMSILWLVNRITWAQKSLECPTPQPNESFCMAMDPPPPLNYTLQTTICKQFLFYRWLNRTLLTIIVLGRPKYKIKMAIIQVRVNSTPVGTYLDRKGLIHFSCPPGKNNVAYFCNRMNPYYFVVPKWVVPEELANTNFTSKIHVTVVCDNGVWKMARDVVPFHEFKWELPDLPTMKYLN